jgi:CTP:molybdopterin cytidylyltransferase MocA
MTPLIPSAATGLLLTAGRGSRLGGCCKGLLQIDGQPLVVRQLRTMADAGIRRAVVVIGAQADAIAQALSRHAAALSELEITQVRIAFEQLTDDPQFSVVSGLKAALTLPQSIPAPVFVSLVDLPLLTARHYETLWAQAHDQDADIVLPRNSAGTPGHPIVLAASVITPSVLGQPGFRLREFVGAGNAKRYEFLTEDPAYFSDLDTPQDLQNMAAVYGVFLGFPDP